MNVFVSFCLHSDYLHCALQKMTWTEITPLFHLKLPSNNGVPPFFSNLEHRLSVAISLPPSISRYLFSRVSYPSPAFQLSLVKSFFSRAVSNKNMVL